MANGNVAEDRIRQLEEALELSTKLNSVLAKIGPNSFKGVCSPSNNPDAYARIQSLERSLFSSASSWPHSNQSLSPFMRLTDDLVQYIFELALTANPLDWPQAPSNYRHLPAYGVFPLLNVCRRWRELVLGTKSLWASLEIRVPQRDDPLELVAKHPSYSRFTQRPISEKYMTFVTRSDPAPLQVHIQLEDAPYADKVVDAFKEHCGSRTQDLYMQNHGIRRLGEDGAPIPATLAVPQTILGCLKECTSTLTKLEIFIYEEVDTTSADARDVIRQAMALDRPELREVTLCNIPTPETDGRVALLTHCRSLNVKLYHRHRFLFDPDPPPEYRFNPRFLSHCLELRELSLSVGPPESPRSAEDGKRILLPKLEKLEIECENESSTTLFNRLEVPALTHLSVKECLLPVVQGTGPTESIPRGVLDMLKASSYPSLLSLRVRGLNKDQLALIVEAVPTIAELSLDAQKSSREDRLLRNLSGVSDGLDPLLSVLLPSRAAEGEEAPPSSCPCPALKIVTVEHLAGHALFSKLLRFIRARKEAGHPIPRLKFPQWLTGYTMLTSGMTVGEMRELASLEELKGVEKELGGLVEELWVGRKRYRPDEELWK